LIGIDHGFSFPLKYFQKYGLPHDWPAFLADFQKHWLTDADNTYVDFVREGTCGNAKARCGDSRWKRLTEMRAQAKSVFHFDVPRSVAKSTHAGIPWVRYLRNRVADRVHFWPFEGWQIADLSFSPVEIFVVPSHYCGVHSCPEGASHAEPEDSNFVRPNQRTEAPE
jgi:hypothetical protein